MAVAAANGNGTAKKSKLDKLKERKKKQKQNKQQRRCVKRLGWADALFLWLLGLLPSEYGHMLSMLMPCRQEQQEKSSGAAAPGAEVRFACERHASQPPATLALAQRAFAACRVMMEMRTL